MKDRIEKRLTELRQQREMLAANLHAVSGAITTLESLLQPEENPPTPQPAPADGRVSD